MNPIWYYDDINQDFQQLYLQSIFPLAVCAFSVLVIALRSVNTWVKARRKEKYDKLVDFEDEEELTLQKSVTNVTTYDVDKPKGETGVVAVELLVLCGQLAISVISLLHDQHRRSLPPIAHTILWAYLLLLATLRLYFTTVERRLPFLKLWNHCAVVYGLEWLCEIMVFRSAIIHPRSSLSQSLTIAQFALTSVLGVVVLTSRRGNRAITVEHEADIEPSREPFASLLSSLTYAWADGIIWRGFKRPLELTDVWNVASKDKAERVLDRFRQIKKTHILAVQLLLFFKKQILLQGLWCAISSVAMFMPTLLLKAILEYLEDPTSTSTNAAWLYVILLFATGVVQAVGDGQALWIGRKICIQIRAVIVGEIYSKVLRRKAAAAPETEPDKVESTKPRTLWQKMLFWKTRKDESSMNGHANPIKPGVPTQASNGTVINLMSIDSFKVAEISAYLHFLWAATPVQLIMAVGLLYKVLGYSSFVGIVLMVLVLPWNMWIAKSFTKAQKAILAATDGRIHATNEVLQNIRIIKYFAWEQRFQDTVNDKRKTELTAIWRKYILWAAAYTMWGGVPIVITFASFLIYTKVERRPLIPSIAFPALSMFSLLRIPLDQLADMVAHVQESKVSVDRVEEFLREDETEKYLQLKQSKQASPHETRIALEHATLTWGSTSDTPKVSSNSFRLIDMDINFAIGKLNVIVGPTGCGKSSLLMALLGEMQLLDGVVHIPGGYSRQQLKPDPETGLTESVAYCAQQAWLVNATIKENILFASSFDANRYRAVIAACALQRDLEILDAGDQTLVGEKGITLSGGQKQRISLARALYSTSKHLLLDDCLSAVDSHTGKHIFNQALMGKLMNDRTCVLVSHNVALTMPQASHVVVLGNGKIVCQGSPVEVLESGHLGEEMAKSVPTSRMPSAAPSRAPSPPIEQQNELPEGPTTTGEIDVPEESQLKADRKFVDTRVETKATGSVKWTTIQMYLQAMGSWYYWIFAGSGFIAVQLGSIATNLWIRQWSNAYHTSAQSSHAMLRSWQHQPLHDHHLSGGLSMQASPATYARLDMQNQAHDHVDSTYYLGVYALIGTAFIVICFTRELLLFFGSLRASRILHERLLGNILRATFGFFDSTPLGQLTNRFSKDLQSIDQEVAPVAVGLLHSAAAVVTIVILITVITPGFLIPGVFIAAIYVLTGILYIRSSRDLKRIESVQRSPLFQHFGETLSGVVTIRAYGDESRFVTDSHNKVNTHNRPFIYLWATNRWLAFRVDCAGALVAFFSAMFVVQNVGNIDPGAAGLSLSYAITFTQNVLWLVRLYAANEQNMNAVERVQEYINVVQEARANIPENKPIANWPSQGRVEFINYATRYRKDLDPVLRNVTFKIAAGEKVGIVGRTGAGKSSLALALFRGLEAEEGKIILDDVDIGLIGLQDLREAITIVPQDPTLFTGSLRSNLDPFGLFTDEEIFTALRRVQLISDATRKASHSSQSTAPSAPSTATTINGTGTLLDHDDTSPSANGTMSSGATLVRFKSNPKDNKNMFYDLSFAIAESGSNLSQGQRQLLCLARALLKSPRVLMMDEATASIDYATDSKIQDTLRELKDNTIITIAHRLQTIIDYDKVLVLDKGEVVEYAHPWELIQKDGGSFRGMCETSGDLETLLDLAKKAWDAKRLVDV